MNTHDLAKLIQAVVSQCPREEELTPNVLSLREERRSLYKKYEATHSFAASIQLSSIDIIEKIILQFINSGEPQ